VIGNDIVYLGFAKLNSRWQEQRFLDKLFSAEEQDYILSDGKRFQNIWRLWSMKESVYKIISRANGIVRFNPKDFKCLVKDTTQGHVVFGNTVISTLTETQSKFIQTTAFLEKDWTSEVFQLLHSDFKWQQIQSYQRAVKAYAHLMKVSHQTVKIIKNKTGVPQFYIDGSLQPEHMSLTHHGHFGAFAIAV
jgi:phosphopantetheinyl transferase (holo-ACP synthase)